MGQHIYLPFIARGLKEMEREVSLIVFGRTYQVRKGAGCDYQAYEQKSNLCYAVGIGGCKSIIEDWTGFTKRTNQPPRYYRVDFKDGSYTTIPYLDILKIIYSG